ncbi:unnamed protein product [Knipowitschia caucasica]
MGNAIGSSEVNFQSNEARGQKLVKVFSIISARTNGADRQILDQLTAQGITPTHDLHQSDVILLFCPILTRTASHLTLMQPSERFQMEQKTNLWCWF